MLPQKLSTKHRPEEIAWWMQRQRRFDVIPEVNPSEFGTEWQQWWSFIQPDWREDDTWPHSQIVPNGADWTALTHGGPNGLFLVMMALSWWVRKIVSDEDREFLLAVGDVHWVMKEMMKTISATGVKRSIIDDCKDQPSAKR
jgi:hypothetical protein